jgi:hypothetical protein
MRRVEIEVATGRRTWMCFGRNLISVSGSLIATVRGQTMTGSTPSSHQASAKSAHGERDRPPTSADRGIDRLAAAMRLPRLSPILTVGLAIGLVLALWVGTALMRAGDFRSERGARNANATYHMMLTAAGYAERPVSEHLYLPLLTLGGDLNTHIMWGTSIETPAGVYLYTSFYSPSFMLAAAWFAVLGTPPTMHALAWLSATLGLVSALLLVGFVLSVLRHSGSSGYHALCVAVLAVVPALFSREALHSQGIVYWAHTLFQPLLIVALWGFWTWLLGHERNDATGSGAPSAAVVIAMAFVAPLVEWTGFVVNVGLVVAILGAVGWRRGRGLAVGIAIASLLAAGGMLFHLTRLIPWSDLFEMSVSRYAQRAGGGGGVNSVLRGWALSYGLFLFVALGVSGWVALSRPLDASPASDENSPARRGVAVLWLMFAAMFPLVENVILRNHATIFTFDRLKFAVPLVLFLTLMFDRLTVKGFACVTLAMAFGTVEGRSSYLDDLGLYSKWTKMHEGNVSLAAKVAAHPTSKCAVFGTGLRSRGYMTLLFHRNFYEEIDQPTLETKQRERGACGTVLIDGRLFRKEYHHLLEARITNAQGETTVLTP